MSAHKKLQEARIQLQGKQLKKSGHNKFAGYEYFELGDFLPTIQDIFQSLGLCGTINFNQLAELRICDVDKPDDFIIFSCPIAQASLKGCHEVQNLGASITYLRRYLWVNALEIVEHDALDATTGSGVHKPTKDTTFKPDAEEETFLLSVVDSVLAEKSDIPAAHDLFYEQNLDNDQKVWIWDKLGKESALRSAIKKYHQSKEQ